MKRLLVISFLLLALIPFATLRAQAPNAIMLANYFLLSGTTLDDDATVEQLARYDLLIIPVEAQAWNPDFSDDIRDLNPDITLLAYVPTVSWNESWIDSVHKKLERGIEDDYWLRTSNGSSVSIWPGTQALDLTSGWNDYLANFVADTILDDDYWDGVFYDEVNDEISWTGDLKLSSGRSDIDDAWLDAYTDLFRTTRNLVGDKIIISNGSSELQHADYVNGRMYESFPTPWEQNGSWETVMDRSEDLRDHLEHDPVIIFNADTGNTGDQEDYASMRFGLGSALMQGNLFGFDYGTSSHQQIWWYDEYDAYLGEAKEEAIKRDEGVWERDFSNGKVVINPTKDYKTIRLDGEYEKIHGTQDTIVNDGSIVTRVSLESEDAVILLRPLESIVDGVFENGAFTRVFDGDGDTYRTGFFAYDDAVYGGMQVIRTDLDYDGKRDLVAADGNQVFIYNSDGSLHASFYPYTSAYQNGVNIAVADLENDGSVEIVTGTEAGGGAHVRVFNSDGVLINPGFFAYDEVYRGGVNIAIGDLNGDGWKEIICGAGLNGGPHVRIFNKQGNLINPGFFAYDVNSRAGVTVAAGDLDGDGIDEIITGTGAGAAPEIKAFTQDGVQVTDTFYAFDATDRDGVRVSTADMDGDGIAEILALTQDVFTLSSLLQ